ncbi:unnamed protein product [Didymodactylos carnosus]|uniref:Putative exosome complex component RRP41 n=1 Tax=Didymodactylos carnosus TaxID=1234261 RepID=A0A815F990_9BILA|nr:unnamed protein product [Didymodactylos carnosus]CAF1337532.1 unnamed protein product [Didymodactylos carnosus]CAF4148779.1 unnamed protein product [Didymodactylos carnosus]CAF4174714.1 unnamed protein product [Didymodactylos carnosus]
MDTSSTTMKTSTKNNLTSTSNMEHVAAFDLISVEGYRMDGRKSDELRQFRCLFNTMSDADGSCYLEHGNCKLLAMIYGPYEGRSNQEQAVITCDFSMTQYCVSERRLKTYGDLKSQKIQMSIQRVFQQAILTETYPKSQIDIYLKILQSDGNDYCPCVNATTLALINAGIPLKDFVCSSTVGNIQGKYIVDLNQQEEQQQTPKLTLTIMPQRNEIVSLSCESRVHAITYNDMLDSATNACQQLFSSMKQAVIEQLKTSLNLLHDN